MFPPALSRSRSTKLPASRVARTLTVAGCAASGVGILLVAVSFVEAAAIRAALNAVAPDGRLETLEAIGDAGVIAALRRGGGAAFVVGVVVLTLRRRLVDALAAVRPATNTRWLEAAVVGCVLVASVGLSIRNLNVPMRFDEALSVLNFAQRSTWSLLSQVTGGDHFLHILLQRGVYELFGPNPATLRLPAFLAAFATLGALWWFARAEFGWLAAAFAAALLGASPFFIEYATNARGYTLVGLAFVALLLCGRGIARHPLLPGRWAAFAGVSALGVFAHPIAIFPAVIATVWIVFARWRESGVAGLRALGLRGVVWCAIAAAIALCLYAPMLAVSGIDEYLATTGVHFRSHAGFATVLANAPYAWFGWNATTPVWAQGALFLALIVGALAPCRSARRRGVLVAAVAFGTAVVLAAYPVALRLRDTFFLLPPALMVTGAGAATLIVAAVSPRGLGTAAAADRLGRAQFVGAAVVLVTLGGFGWWATRPGVTEHYAKPTGWAPNAPALAAALDGRLQAGSRVIGGYPVLRPVAFYLQARGWRLARVPRRNYTDVSGFTVVDCAAFLVERGPASAAPLARSADPGVFHVSAASRQPFAESLSNEDEPRSPDQRRQTPELLAAPGGAKLYRLRPPRTVEPSAAGTTGRARELLEEPGPLAAGNVAKRVVGSRVAKSSHGFRQPERDLRQGQQHGDRERVGDEKRADAAEHVL